MLDQHGFDIGRIKPVIDRQDVRPGHPEDHFDAKALHIADEQFADLDIHSTQDRVLRNRWLPGEALIESEAPRPGR